VSKIDEETGQPACKLYVQLVMLLFLICLAGTGDAGKTVPIQRVSNPNRPSDLALSPESKDAESYHPTEMGEIRDEDGTQLSFTAWEGAGGSVVTVIHKDFGSPVLASEYFDKQVARAKKVLKLGRQIDGKGKVVGKRAVVVLTSSKNDRASQTPTLLFTAGSCYNQWGSKSFAAVLQMEKRSRLRD